MTRDAVLRVVALIRELGCADTCFGTGQPWAEHDAYCPMHLAGKLEAEYTDASTARRPGAPSLPEVQDPGAFLFAGAKR